MFSQIPTKRHFGYIRVSSKSQEGNSSLDAQKKLLRQEGIPTRNIIPEVGSAIVTIAERPKLYQLINEILQDGDLLMITKIDRVARNTLEFLKIQEKLYEKSITFVSLDLPHSNDSAVNKLIATTLAAIATFETERRKERQRIGIKQAKTDGKYKGRKSVITSKLIATVSDLKENKKLKPTQIAKITGHCPTRIYKVLKQHLGYVPAHTLVQPSSIEIPDVQAVFSEGTKKGSK